MKPSVVKFLKKHVVLVDQGVVSLSRFLLTWLIARFLGIEEYGLYVVLWSFILLLGSIQIPFIINPMLTLGSKSLNKDRDDFFSFYFYFQNIFSLVSVVIMFIIFFAAKLLNIEYSITVFTGVVLYGISYNYYEFCRRYLFTVSKGLFVLISDLLVQVSIFFIVYLAWHIDFLSLEYFLLGSFIIYFLATLVVKRKIRVPRLETSLKTVRFKENLAYSIPMAKLSIAQFFSGHFFIYIAVYLLGQNMAGVIGVLRNIFAPLIVGLMALDNILPQKAMQIFELDIDSLKSYFLANLLKWMVYFGVFTVLVLTYGEVVINELYGLEYIAYVKYLPWFAFTHILMLGVRVLSIYARTINKMKSFSVQGMLTLSFTVIFTYPLIFYLGLNGAFTIMLVQQLLMISVLLIYVRKN